MQLLVYKSIYIDRPLIYGHKTASDSKTVVLEFWECGVTLHCHSWESHEPPFPSSYVLNSAIAVFLLGWIGIT